MSSLLAVYHPKKIPHNLSKKKKKTLTTYIAKAGILIDLNSTSFLPMFG